MGAEIDDAVGAFVRTIQDAPPTLMRAPLQPLHGSSGAVGASSGSANKLTLQGGLEQLSRFKSSLKAL